MSIMFAYFVENLVLFLYFFFFFKKVYNISIFFWKNLDNIPIFCWKKCLVFLYLVEKINIIFLYFIEKNVFNISIFCWKNVYNISIFLGISILSRYIFGKEKLTFQQFLEIFYTIPRFLGPKFPIIWECLGKNAIFFIYIFGKKNN